MSAYVVAAVSILAAVAFGLLAWRQRRELERAGEVADALQQAARTGTSTLPLEQPDDGTIAGRIAGASQLLLTRPAPKRDDGNAALALALGALDQPVLLHRDRLVEVNRAFAQLLGAEPASLVGKHFADLVLPDYRELVRSQLQRRLAGEPAAERLEAEVTDPHGQVTRLELTLADVGSGAARAVLVSATEMLPARTVARPDADRSRVRLACDTINDGLITTDVEGRIDYLNPAAAALLGVTAEVARGQPLAQLAAFIDEQDRRALPDPVQQCLASGARTGLGRRALLVARSGGRESGIELSAAPLREGQGPITGTVIVLHDVTELRGLTRQMSYQASHDALTGLVNRREFERRLEEAVDASRDGRLTHVVCYLDLDRFKAVNDTCGHAAGDNMLREIGALVRGAVRDSDTVGRLGGDEFGVLLLGCPLDKARQIADEVVRAVADYRFVWKDRIFSCGVSIGLVETSRESGSVDELLNAADSACYIAKRGGTNHVHVYSARDEAAMRHRGEIQWLQRLQAALRDGRFELLTQQITPLNAMNNGPSVEVFVRLADEIGKPVAPADFMHAAERYRLMSLVDRWVVQTALAAVGSGAIKLTPGTCLAINLSGQSLADHGFLEFVVDCLDVSGVQPSQVCFEVNETSVIGNLDHARRFAEVLHGMGCRFAIDDFGTDLGAFANLKHLAMDYLKVDAAYTRNLALDGVNQAMVAALVKLARSLDFRIVAEQIEDPATLEILRSLGIDYAQGYAIGRPQALKTAA